MPARKISANAAEFATVSGSTSFHSSGRLTPTPGSANSVT